MYENKKIAVIIAAAGKGTRVGGPVPKQYLKIGGEPVILKTLKAFAALDEVDHIFIVTNEEYMDRCQEIVRDNGLDKVKGIVKGGADKSYGVQVAKLAGVPDAVINRAKEIARELEEHDLTSGAKDIMPYGEAQKLSFFRESDEPTMEHPFMAELREKDLSDMTPLEALNYLYVLQEKLKNEE